MKGEITGMKYHFELEFAKNFGLLMYLSNILANVLRVRTPPSPLFAFVLTWVTPSPLPNANVIYEWPLSDLLT